MNNLVSADEAKTTQSVKVTPEEPEEVLVQRQLESWLEPGWCMTAPTGSEPKVESKKNKKK